MAGDGETNGIPGGPWTTVSITSDDGSSLVLKYGQLLHEPGVFTFVFEEYAPDDEMRQCHTSRDRQREMRQHDVARWLGSFTEAQYALALAHAFAAAYPTILRLD